MIYNNSMLFLSFYLICSSVQILPCSMDELMNKNFKKIVLRNIFTKYIKYNIISKFDENVK